MTERVVITYGTAPAVDVAKRLIAEGFTYDRVTDHLNENGYRTKRGRPWTYYNLRFVMRTITVIRVGRIQRSTMAQKRHPVREETANDGVPVTVTCLACGRVTTRTPCERCEDDGLPLSGWGR